MLREDHRHAQPTDASERSRLDPFVVATGDAASRDQRDLMERSFFSLAKTRREHGVWNALSESITSRELSPSGLAAGSPYRSGERCGDWLKWRANRGQEFVIGGYIPNGSAVDSLLVGYYEGRELMYAARARAGLSSEFRRALFPHFEGLQIARCPFINLPERGEGRWGEGLTAAKMVLCRWLDPFLVARVEFLEWTPENRLRHPRFTALRSYKDAREVVRE